MCLGHLVSPPRHLPLSDTHELTPRAALRSDPDLSSHALRIYLTSVALLMPGPSPAALELYQTCVRAVTSIDDTRLGIARRTTELDALKCYVDATAMPSDLVAAYAVARGLETGVARLHERSTLRDLNDTVEGLRRGHTGQPILTGNDHAT